ncbi:two-component response regulator [[Synechococcus] sp. NIES-970]|uniref:response regulator n=1 Tax=Picosynechococcus sp. NKBG15041c TaxID=1407650 RepID=UPI0003F557F5|nr:response regulator [Picosynechococcus sp. NKBG15041c]BAW95323.1 two-component response regulator [[Synechococcus] sp. NIES-970]
MEVQDIATKTVVIPGKALQTLIERRVSGTVSVYDPVDDSVFWQLYLGGGKLHFATSGMGKPERLDYLLGQLFPSTQFPISDTLSRDYDYICQIWKMGKFSLQQVRQVLFFITQEAVSQFLALPRAAVKFERTLGLDPLLLSLSLRQIVRPLQDTIRSWVQLRSDISSPFQRLYLGDFDQITSQSWLHMQNYELVANMLESLNQKMTLYELSRSMGKTTTELGGILQPFIQAGGIQVLPYEAIASPPKPLIACIDDSKATQRIVKMTLEASGLEVIGVTDPAQALSTFVHKRPELILMDINMPEIDGYELCRMFSQSNLLKNIPVIMLTGRDGLLDRIRARMIGASDYIAKPFDPQDLIQLVQSYIQNATPQSKL